MTVQCDYIVATIVADDPTGLLYQRMLSHVKEGRQFSFRGFRGFMHKNIFIGYRDYDDRIIVQATGYEANTGVSIVKSYSEGKRLSVARFDAQVTFATDNADNTIMFAAPNKRYQAMRVSNLNERGETLYVGSPSSSYRLRVYNKTAQSGIKPDNGEYIRFEIVFRNSLADSAYKAYTEGDIGAYFLGYLSKMVDEVTYSIVKQILYKDMTVNPLLFEMQSNDDIDKTKIWLEQVVAPCLQKLAVRDPKYVSDYISSLDKIKPTMLE